MAAAKPFDSQRNSQSSPLLQRTNCAGKRTAIGRIAGRRKNTFYIFGL
jgi:hypothetical protein